MFYDYHRVETEESCHDIKDVSVCDAVKYRNRIGIDVSSEILHNYLSRKDSDITRLYAYANAMRLGKRMDELVKYMI